MKNRATTVVQISAPNGERERWREIAEADPALQVLPPGRRLSAFVKLAVEARIAQVQEAQ